MNDRIDLTQNRRFRDKNEIGRKNFENNRGGFIIKEIYQYLKLNDYTAIAMRNGKLCVGPASVLRPNERCCDRCGRTIITGTLCDSCNLDLDAESCYNKLFRKSEIPNMPRYFERL